MDGIGGGGSRIYYLKENRRRFAAPRGHRGEENKTREDIAFHERSWIGNGEKDLLDRLPALKSRSSPRAFTGFDERAPSRCVNHELLRRVFESHPLTGEEKRREETERRRGDSRDSVRSESFLRARGYIRRRDDIRYPSTDLLRRCNFIAESRISRQAPARSTPSDFPKTAHREQPFAFPSLEYIATLPPLLPVSSLM